MKAPLNDSVLWTKRGVSVVWDAKALSGLGPMSNALSLRDWFRWSEEGWPEREGYFTGNEGRTIVVAGLDAVIDSLDPEEAEVWLQDNLLPCITDFQHKVAGGGQDAALIFWMVHKKRFRYHTAKDAVRWKCSPAHGQQELPISHCIWNGAQADIKRIIPPDCEDQENGIGLFLRLVS
jgi:hypothetical protein